MDRLRLDGMAFSHEVPVPVAAPGGTRGFVPTASTPCFQRPLRLAEAVGLLPDVRRGLEVEKPA